MRFVNSPDEWTITLVSGHVVTLWAECLGGLEPRTPDEPFVFSALMDIAEGDQRWFEIEGHDTHDFDRVLVVLARFPRNSVAKINNMYPTT